MRFFRTMLAIVALFPLSACGLSGGAIKGQVLEAETNKPIPGAIVVVRWHGTWAPPAGTSACYHVESAMTDVEGRYKTPAWTGPFKAGLIADYWEVDVYKPGYEEMKGSHVVQGGKTDISYLAPFKGTREERMRALWSTGIACESAGNSARNLIPLYRALYQEASGISQTKNDRQIVDALLYELEKLELGYEEATKRMLQRK